MLCFVWLDKIKAMDQIIYAGQVANRTFSLLLLSQHLKSQKTKQSITIKRLAASTMSWAQRVKRLAAEDVHELWTTANIKHK